MHYAGISETDQLESIFDIHSFNLESAVRFDFIVQDIDMHSEFKKCVVTLLVISSLLNLLGASRACARNRDLTADYRFKYYS